jgi:hypothetical protein
MKSYFDYLNIDIRMSPQHRRAEKKYELNMQKAVKKGSIKEFEREIARYEKMERKSEQRAARKYDRETRHDW